MLLNIFDVDRSGAIGFNEFQGLWQYITDWQATFKRFDHDRSGTIEARELFNALSSFGYNLSPRLVDLLQKKYSECHNLSLALRPEAPPAAEAHPRLNRPASRRQTCRSTRFPWHGTRCHFR